MTNVTTKNIKLIVLRSKLMEAVGSVERSIGNETSSLPILRNVLLQAGDGKIGLTTTNLETVVEHKVTGKVMQSGEITVPMQVLGSVVKSISGARISLEQDGARLKIVTDSYEGELLGQPADDFPIVPSVEAVLPAAVFLAGDLRDYLSRAAVAAQYSDIRPEISGVRITVGRDEVCFAATDSFRLVEQVVRQGDAAAGGAETAFTVPIRAAADVARVFSDDSERVEILCDATQVCFKSATRRVISRLVDGAFPDYKQIVPREFKAGAAVNRLEFLEGVKAVSAFSGKGNDVTVRTGKSGKFLELYSSSQALGESVYRVPARTKDEGFSVVLNWRYLLDGVKIYRGEEINIGVNSADKPVGLQSPAEARLIYIVMPIRS